MDATSDPQVLMRNVVDKASKKRIESMRVLGAMRCVEACNWLSYALEDKDRLVRRSALRALEDIGEPAYPQIVYALKSSHADVRKLAVEALGRMKSEGAVPLLTRALQDHTKPVRLSAISALGNFSTPGAIEALKTALTDPDRDIQEAARKALLPAGPEACDAVRGTCDDENARLKKLTADILGKTEYSQQTHDIQHDKPHVKTQAQADNARENPETPRSNWLDLAARIKSLNADILGKSKQAQQTEDVHLSSTKTCERCNSLFEPSEQDANEVLCIKCLSELSVAATDVVLGVRTCLYCGKKFKPDDASSVTGFCSASCFTKALSDESTDRYPVAVAAYALEKTEQAQKIEDVQQEGHTDARSQADITKTRAEFDTTGRSDIPVSEVAKTVSSMPPPSEPDSVANVTGVHTRIKLEASNSNPVIHEAVTFTVTLTAYVPLSKSVTIWHTLNGVRYNDITMGSTCTFSRYLGFCRRASVLCHIRRRRDFCCIDERCIRYQRKCPRAYRNSGNARSV